MKLLLGAACVALAGGLMTACTQDETEGLATGKLVPMTFTAGTAQTRTALGDDGMAVNWTLNDKVAIWDGTYKNEFTATTVDGSNATLEGEAQTAESYTAFYPYAAVTDITHDAITFTLPAEQTATAGTFANSLAPSWAQTTDGSSQLQFRNLCALVKFTVDEDMAGEGTFTLKGAKSESLAGSLTYAIGGDGEASVGSNASTEVKLSGTFEAGKTYYFVVAPATLEAGLSLFYKGSEGATYRRAGASSVTFGAGKVTDLGTLTLGGFTEAITNSTFIWVLGQNGCTLEQNADGSVTLTEECKQQLASITSLNLSGGGIGDLSDLRYFTGLIELRCPSNGLKTLDVSMLTNLTTLDCSLNQLETLDVSKLTNLTTLNCIYNQLETLNVSGLTNLTTLNCNYNQLETLDVSNLTQLQTLLCYNNLLTELNVSNLTQLQTLICYNNLLTELNVSNLPQLQTLKCYNNLLTELNVSNLPQLNILQCYNNRMSALDLTHNLNLNQILTCGSQTSDGVTAQELQLTLPATLSGFWTTMLTRYPTDNAGVTVNYPYDAGHDGFEEGDWRGRWD